MLFSEPFCSVGCNKYQSRNVFKTCMCCLGDKNSAVFSRLLSIKYLLNTFVPSMFYFSIKLGTAPKDEIFADRLISKYTEFTQWMQMPQRACKHLLGMQKCLVITNPPSSSLQKSCKAGAFNF